MLSLYFFIISSCTTYFLFIFFFNDTATTDIYTYLHTLSLHDALPILHFLKYGQAGAFYGRGCRHNRVVARCCSVALSKLPREFRTGCFRSEEHTSELQSLMRISYAVFCLKKKKSCTLSNIP